MKKLLIALMLISPVSFADVVTLECDYPTWSDSSGAHKATDFSFKFLSDSESGKTYMNGSSGSTEVMTLSREDGGINFIEVTSTGNVMVTTVLGGGASVHSRNSVIVGELIPSQYYGNCKVK